MARGRPPKKPKTEADTWVVVLPDYLQPLADSIARQEAMEEKDFVEWVSRYKVSKKIARGYFNQTSADWLREERRQGVTDDYYAMEAEIDPEQMWPNPPLTKQEVDSKYPHVFKSLEEAKKRNAATNKKGAQANKEKANEVKEKYLEKFEGVIDKFLAGQYRNVTHAANTILTKHHDDLVDIYLPKPVPSIRRITDMLRKIEKDLKV